LNHSEESFVRPHTRISPFRSSAVDGAP
jgi:hypothetical protein